MSSQWFAIGVALDRLVNTLLLGDYRETLSGRAHRAHRDGKPWGWARHLINCLFFWQTDHCAEAWAWDRDWREQRPLKD
jgi:hypothetical protein